MRHPLALLISVLMLVGLAAAPASAHPRHPHGKSRPVPGLVVTESTRGFQQTYDALVDALEANPNISVVAEVDHAANAEAAELSLPPTREVFFGNPALGTPLMQADQVAGIDLPQKMLVWQERGAVFVAYNATEYLAARHDVDEVATLEGISTALATLASVAAGVDVDDVGDAAATSTHRLRQVECHPGLRSIRSQLAFDETVEELTAAIEDGAPELAFTLDHQANAARAGLELRPTTLVVFGAPALGTPLMQPQRTVGIDLPQKFLVHEDAEGDVRVTWNDPFFVAHRHRIRGERDTLRSISAALEDLSAAGARAA